MTTDRPWLDPAERDAASREATDIQRLGADPDASVILRASAGAGKTKVLIDRLLRLLLSGRPVKSVVAMTFTRKAAVEIKERLQRKVGALAALDDQAREAELRKLLHRDPTTAERTRAAQLAEDLLEDPAGLHVGTIHTFCQTLLSHFADEAGIDPAYRILEDGDELWQEALDLLERDIAANREQADAWAALAPTPDGARGRLDQMLNLRMELDRWAERLAEPGPLPKRRLELLEAMSSDLRNQLLDGTPLADHDDPGHEALIALAAERARVYAGAGLDAVPAADDDPSKTLLTAVDQRRTQVLDLALRLDGGDHDAFDDLMKVVLTQKGSPRAFKQGSRDGKDARNAALADATAPLQAVAAASRMLELHRDNHALLHFGLTALDHFEDLKRRDRVLDFHDLEVQARRLVQDPDLGQWIVYRMDARLDHLLVDEFQDTNRNQWDLIAPFAEEFVAGADEAGRPRSTFFVGDVKQSIYRFRGACPEIFGETVRWLGRVREHPLLTLPTNFRSLPAVVSTVGEAFGSSPLRELLPDPGEIQAVVQKPFRDQDAGHVVVHPLDEGEDDGPTGHEAAAQRAVGIVNEILSHGVVYDEDGEPRPATLGDILVLSRSRTHIDDYERAFRNAHLPYVPAGRGALARSREVRDVLALLRWLTFPADGVALGTALRSPLFRIGEADLQNALASARRSTDLWPSLRDIASPPAMASAVASLKRWLGRVGLEPCHDLLRRIFRETEALDRCEAALGEQSRFNLLRLHDLALEHDQSSFPTLRGFVRRIERAAVRSDQEEATLPETEQGRIQILTIHGAKGLERPFVLLVDAGAPLKERLGHIVFPDARDRGAMALGVTRGKIGADDAAPTRLSRAARESLAAELREEANLLYVAATRAQDELHVLGAAPASTSQAPSHHRWLCEALALSEDHGERGRAAHREAEADDPGPAAARPDRLTRLDWDPGTVAARGVLRNPSSLAPATEDQAPPQEAGGFMDPRAAAARGTRIHLWLQRAAETGAMPPGEGEEWEEARAVFENPRHDAIFRPPPDVTAHCEVGVLHRRTSDKSPTTVQGVIDRLLVEPGRILIVDYKSNMVDPGRTQALLEHYRPQLEAYRAALSARYPDREIAAALLFTHLGTADDRGVLLPLA